MVSEKRKKVFVQGSKTFTKFWLLLAILSFKKKKKKQSLCSSLQKTSQSLNLLLAISSETKKGYKNWQEEYSKQKESWSRGGGRAKWANHAT